MTAQEIFDRVWRHFVTEGNPLSSDGGGVCFYRGPNGMRCAVGIFIPDDEYDPICEGSSISMSLRRLGPTVQGLAAEHEHLLSRLQGAHDRAAASGMPIRDALTTIAISFGLAVPS